LFFWGILHFNGWTLASGVKHGWEILHLVGGFNPSDKYEFVNGKDNIPYIMENKKWSKPPIRLPLIAGG
jgi:hypothetical protein